MLPLSSHYEAQSLVNIRRAQAIAKTDQSGYALGTAMYLGQQALELQLKSIMLRLDETIKMGSANRILRSLSHEFYPKLYEAYEKHIEKWARGLLADYDGVVNTDWAKYDGEMHAGYFRKVSSYWARYQRNRRMQSLTWEYSLGVRLSKANLEMLGAWHSPNTNIAMGDTSDDDARIPALANAGHLEGRIRVAILYDSALAVYRLMYADSPSNRQTQKALSETFEETKMLFMPGIRHLVRSDLADGFRRGALLEFGFRVMASANNLYLLTYPHGIIGRYPEILDDGSATPEVYKRHVNNVLFCLFVAVPHHLEQLRKNSGLINTLSATGKRLGYWK